MPAIHTRPVASAKGRAAGDTAIYEAFRHEVSRLLASALTQHDTRRISATTGRSTILSMRRAKDLRGDRSDRVYDQHYNLAGGVEASRKMAAAIARLKREPA